MLEDSYKASFTALEVILNCVFDYGANLRTTVEVCGNQRT